MNNKEAKNHVWTGERLETHIYNDVAVEHLHRYAVAMEIVLGKDVLDIASGEGYGSHLMAKVANSVIGIDISDEIIKNAKKTYIKDNLIFLQGSVESIPIPSKSIDVVVSFETLEHHDRHHEMMKEIKRVLKDNGVLIISTPEKYFSDIFAYKNKFHIKELYLSEFKELISTYFKNSEYYYQRIILGSIFLNESRLSNIQEIWGDYDYIECSQEEDFPLYKKKLTRKLNSPCYNICIASGTDFKVPSNSFFDGKEILEYYMMHCVKQLISYKVGHTLLSPFRYLRNLLKFR